MKTRILPLALSSSSWLRLDRLMLLSRHDCGALPLAVFNIVKKLETEIAWREHTEHANPHKSADQPTAHAVNRQPPAEPNGGHYGHQG